MTRAYIISDLHLGNAHCRHDAILDFLAGLTPDAHLILNGDVVQWSDITLGEKDQRVLDQLRNLSLTRRVIWVRGNHDDDYVLDDPGGITFHDTFAMSKELLIAHGHHFDKVMPRHNTFMATFRQLYHVLSRPFSRRVHVAKFAKRFVLLYAVLRRNVARNAVAHARENAYAAVTCGHTHFAEDRVIEGIRYINTGAWTESPSHYLEIDEQGCKLQTWP